MSNLHFPLKTLIYLICVCVCVCREGGAQERAEEGLCFKCVLEGFDVHVLMCVFACVCVLEGFDVHDTC